MSIFLNTYFGISRYVFVNNKSMKKKIIIHYPLLVFFLVNIFSILLLFYFYNNDSSNYIVFKTVMFIILLWVPYLISKVIQVKIPSLIYKLYFFIIFIDLMLGKIFMFERFTNLYTYVVLFLQGIIFYIIGLWVIKFLDDYGFLNYKIIMIFSVIFALCLAVLKEMFFYLVNKTFKNDSIDQMLYIIISFIGSLFIMVIFIVDNIYYKQKYYFIIDKNLSNT